MSLFDNDSYLTRVVLIPSAVFLSAIFGGAYGSGREIVEFMTRYGPVGGLLSIVTIALAFAGCLFLCFEIARLTRAYDYHAFGRVLLRGASPALRGRPYHRSAARTDDQRHRERNT